MRVAINVLYEDDSLLVINKPPTLLSIPDRYNPDKKNLSDYLNAKYDSIFIVHRLDFETSGVICFAKNKSAHQSLNGQFERRSVEKTYHALIHGVTLQDEGRIEFPLKRTSSGKVIVDQAGKESITNYKLIKAFRDYSYLELKPETGRTHQIRVHLSSIGHPIVGDSKYGGRSFYLSSVKRKYTIGKNKVERPLISRTALHASSIKFKHPDNNELITVSAPLAKDMRVTYKQLDKFG